jgi:predicted MFS family arabinose efflux permease
MPAPERKPETVSMAPTTRSSGIDGANDTLESPRDGGRDGGGEVATAGISRGLTRVLAFACGAIVANLYYSQPLLHTIAGGLHTSQASAALLVTVTQLAYAAGLLLIVPAGDIVRRRPLFVVLLVIDTAALAASAAAPDLRVLGALAILVGLTSVVVQMLVPFAATLAAEHERSRVIGTLMSGLLTGILLSRTFASVSPNCSAGGASTRSPPP